MNARHDKKQGRNRPDDAPDVPGLQSNPKKRKVDMTINKIDTSKDKIRNPPLAEEKMIPRLGTSTCLNGTTGQGKSTLLANLITDPRFFGHGGKGTFDHKFLISPTAEGDDVQKDLGIKPKFTISDLKEAPKVIKKIMELQKQAIVKNGNDKAPQIALIYDDVISDPKFMRTDEFIKSFIASRHYNLTTFVCSQSWTSVPRRCRLQCTNIFFFAAPQSEIELLSQEYTPPGFNKKQFFALVEYATEEPYSFLYINKSAPMEERFRKNLDTIIDLQEFQAAHAHLNTKSQTEHQEKQNDNISRRGEAVEREFGQGPEQSGGAPRSN